MGDESSEDVMTDADFEKALDALREQEPTGEVGELLKMMNENRMISWEEAEQILGGSSYNEPVKSSLPEQTRPSEPDNDTDVDVSIQRLTQDDPELKEINLNNMKRTPIPQVKRLISAIRDNTHLEKLALANMGLYDSNVEPLIDVVENNETLKSINLETNYLSGDFFSKLFKAALKNQTLEEVKAVNQGVTFSTTSEKEIIDAIFENRGIIKVSINLRLPEGRHKIENAMLRNGEIKRVLRRQAAQAAKAAAEEEAKKAESAPKPTTATGKKTDEVTKPKKPLNKTASPTTPAKTTAAKPAPSKPATAPKTSLTKTPASDASSTDTGKKVPPKTAPKSTTAKGTAASSTKAPPLSKSTALDGTPSSDQKPAAGTTKKLATAKPTNAAGTTEKPKTKAAPAVPPKKKIVKKKAAEKSDATDGANEGEAAATTTPAKPTAKSSGTPSKVSTTPKKTATSSTKPSSDQVSEPSRVYPLKKTSVSKATK